MRVRSDDGLSPPTRMPESEHLQNATRHPIVEVVTDTGQSHTTQAFHASAPCRRAHTRLSRKYCQNFSDVLAGGAARGRSILRPPLCGLLDPGESLREDPDFER